MRDHEDGATDVLDFEVVEEPGRVVTLRLEAAGALAVAVTEDDFPAAARLLGLLDSPAGGAPSIRPVVRIVGAYGARATLGVGKTVADTVPTSFSSTQAIER